MIYANDRVYQFNPTVKDMMLVLYATHNKDIDLMLSIFEKYEVVFDYKSEIDGFIDALFPSQDRFLHTNEDEKKKSFDLFCDSDLIYADFVKNYPSKVKSMEDLQYMSWWEFKILLGGIGTSINDRSALRARKIPKKADSSEKTSLTKAKKQIRINDFIKDNHYLKNKRKGVI